MPPMSARESMNAPNATRDRSADLQIVLRAIARTAAKVCEANDALIILVQGDKAAVVARLGFLPTRHKLGEAYPLTDDMVGNRVITQRRTIHLRDLSKAPRERFVGSKAAHLPLGVRTMLVTPLLRDGDAIGAIGIRRTKVQPFTRSKSRYSRHSRIKRQSPSRTLGYLRSCRKRIALLPRLMPR
jgi:GAF domain